jgi:hypothetical protein
MSADRRDTEMHRAAVWSLADSTELGLIYEHRFVHADASRLSMATLVGPQNL